MRISELSRRTGVPVATIKFYLRERLLPPGTPTSRNQASYGDSHRRRLALIRGLTAVAQLDLTSVRRLLQAIEDDKAPLTELYRVIHDVLFPAQALANSPPDMEHAHAEVDEFVAGLGWQVEPGGPGRVQLALVLATLRTLGCDCDIDFFTPYVQAAERLAASELGLLPTDDASSDRAAVVIRSILLAVAFTSMRLMAEEHQVRLRSGERSGSRLGYT